MAVAYEPRRFSVDEYYAIAAAGVFAPGERIELLDGEIVTMAPIGPRHGGDVDRLNRLFSARFGTRAIVRVQGPVRLSRDSEVQPDIALLRLRDDFYGVRHPAPADVFALIEVAESSLAYDRGKKRKAYAGSGIADYWLIDLAHAAVTLFREPSGSEYISQRATHAGETVALLAFPDDAIGVAELLP
jgi:Uma2 family endonuclease